MLAAALGTESPPKIDARQNSGGMYEEEVELVSWAPPTNWEKLMLTGELENQKHNGVSITTGNFVHNPNPEEVAIAERLISFVEQSRKRYPLKRETNLPLPVLLLACVKFRNPRGHRPAK